MRQSDVKTEQSYERQIHTHKYSSGTGEREKQEVKKKIKKKTGRNAYGYKQMINTDAFNPKLCSF